MPTATVYVVSADAAMRACLVELLRSASLRSKAFTDLQACLDHVGSDRIGCLLIDLPANAYGGSEPSQLAAARARMPTLVIVDRGDVPQAVSALKAGGLVILERPVTRADLLAGIRRAGANEGLRT
jgi:FixJ family two-component response regulator